MCAALLCDPDFAAKVVKQFMTYEPETATNQANTFASRGDKPSTIQAIEKMPKSTRVLTAPTRAKLMAFRVTRILSQSDPSGDLEI